MIKTKMADNVINLFDGAVQFTFPHDRKITIDGGTKQLTHAEVIFLLELAKFDYFMLGEHEE
jgi:hypothetical protein